MKNVIYIDDDKDARETYAYFLEKLFGDEFTLNSLEPNFEIEKMLEVVSNFNGVVAYILDEKLNHLGKANYLGQQLASRLRDIDTKVPIYIMTAYKNEFTNDYEPSSVEFVIDKDAISDRKASESISTKFKRHQNTYSDIQSERAQRLDYLLRRSLDGDIDESEKVELDQINFYRTKTINLSEVTMVKELEKIVGESENALSEIDKLLKEIK